MEETIYLETDEEITSVIDKLKSAESKSVKLMVPRGATILQSVVNLRLIKEEAYKLKKEIAIITSDKIGRRLASQVGLPVYEDASHPLAPEPLPSTPQPEEVVEIDMSKKKTTLPKDIKVHYYREPVEVKAPFQLKKRPVEVTEPTPPPPVTSPIKPVSQKRKFPLIWVVSIILILGLGLVLTDLLLSLVKVSLRVPAEPIEKAIELEITDRIAADQLEEGKIKGEFLEVEKVKNQTFEATGKKNVGEKATGTLNVFNEAGVDQTIEKDTTLKASPGQIFKATEAATVSKATLNPAGDKIAGKTSLKVIAEETGKGSNLSESTTYQVVGKDRLSASGKTSGGSDKEVKVVLENDLKSASEKLASDLADETLSELKQKAKTLFIIEGGTENEIMESYFSQKAGAESSNFEAKVKIKARTLAFPEESLREVTLNLVSKELPQTKALVLGESDTISTKITELNLNEGKMVLQVILKAHLADKINEEELQTALKGKSLIQAQEILEELPEVQSVEIQRTPSFGFQRMPLVKRNIKLKLEYQE